MLTIAHNKPDTGIVVKRGYIQYKSAYYNVFGQRQKKEVEVI